MTPIRAACLFAALLLAAATARAADPVLVVDGRETPIDA